MKTVKKKKLKKTIKETLHEEEIFNTTAKSNLLLVKTVSFPYSKTLSLLTVNQQKMANFSESFIC